MTEIEDCRGVIPCPYCNEKMKLQSRCFMNRVRRQKASHMCGSCVREMIDFRLSSTTVTLHHDPAMLRWSLPMESNREHILCVMDSPDTIN